MLEHNTLYTPIPPYLFRDFACGFLLRLADDFDVVLPDADFDSATPPFFWP